MNISSEQPKYEYKAKPQQPQKKTVKNEDGTEYEMVGDFFQCARCDKFTVHKDNDRVCHNSECPTNARKQPSRSKKCTNCSNLLTATEQMNEKLEGSCKSCYSRTQVRQQTAREGGFYKSGQNYGQRQQVKTCPRCYKKYPPTYFVCKTCNNLPLR